MGTELIIAVVSLTVASVALIMAAPTIFQVLWGWPRITITFDVDRDISPGEKIFECNLFNLPVGGWKRKIGVRRVSAEDVVAHFSIQEAGTNKVILSGHVPEIKMASGLASQRARLPSSGFPISFMVAFTQDVNGETKTKTVADMVLPVGVYRVFVEIAVSERSFEGEAIINVGHTVKDTYWSPRA